MQRERDYDALGSRLARVDWSKESLKPFNKNFYKVSVCFMTLLGT